MMKAPRNQSCKLLIMIVCGHGGSLVDSFRLKGRGFESRSSHHVATLGKSFTRSCLWHFSVKFRHSCCAVSGAPLSSIGLEKGL